MKVHELMEILADLDPDRDVLLARNTGRNSIPPLVSDVEKTFYAPIKRWYGKGLDIDNVEDIGVELMIFVLEKVDEY